MGIRIVVGGPPHSGKSTFTLRLEKTLFQEFGVDVNSFGLDPWDRSLDVMLRHITEKQRKQKNEKISERDLQKLASKFNTLSKKHKIVLGDLPGLRTDKCKIVLQTGKYGIIVCKDDEPNEIQEWTDFFSNNGVELIAIITTSMAGNENVLYDNNLIRAHLVNLDKSVIITSGIRSIASSLQSRLGVYS